MKTKSDKHPVPAGSGLAALMRTGALVLALAAGATLPMADAFAQAQSPAQAPARPMSFQRETSPHAGELVVAVNKSEILRLDQPFNEILVGSPEIADVMALTNRSIYVLGKAVGTTNLTIYGPQKRLIAVVDLVVSYDAEGLKAKLYEIMPGETIEVRGLSGALALSGGVSSASALAQAVALAERYAPGKVNNLLQVKGSQQVMLQVKFASVQRSLIKDLRTGSSLRYTSNDQRLTVGGGDRNLNTLVTPGAITIRELSMGAGLGTIVAGAFALSAAFDAYETQGLVKTLAEPNLIALSGETASFLAGGEFPFPVAQSATGAGGAAAITVEFKQFGVGLAFTPTVLGSDLISLAVAPEVSAIDDTVSVTIAGTRVPGLTTRRAKTVVELRDGQSFMIAGLLQNDFSDSINRFPWLGDVPILGNLFRSPSFNRRETELVVLVTPRLVKPAKASTLAAPTDRFVPPSDQDLFLFGRMEPSPAGGGLSGQYGHIVK